MEGIPRLKMIYFPMKEIYDPIDFEPLKKYVSDHYDESPGDYEHEFTELQNVRKSACSPSPDMAGLNVMKRYFCQLHLLRGRFPMEEGEACAVAFSWEDVYQKMPVVSADIRFEEMSILFNIGALHSRLGARETRTESESMKVACTHFQCAAWAFQKIVELSGAHVAWTPDCEPVLLRFKSNIMLGQAQECILEKSILDHRKSAIAAKVAQQLVDFYLQCLQTLQSEGVISVVSSRRHKCRLLAAAYEEWKRTCELKRHYYQAVAYLSMGEAADEGQRYGERLAWFNASVASLEEAQKVAKDMKDDTITDTLRFAFDVIAGRQANAQKENDLIYTERIPDLHSLPEIRAASLVKGLGFETSDKEICGQDIFRRLVPMATHAASSVYSEEKAKLLRKLTEEVEAKNAWMDDFLSSLSIGDAHPVDPPIPQDLLDCCAKLRTRMSAEQATNGATDYGHSTATSESTAALRRLVDVSVDLESNLNQVEEALKEDGDKEAGFRAKYPSAPASPGGSELAAARAELDELQGSVVEARTANAALRAALERELRNVARLLRPPAEIVAALPSVRRVTEETEARKVLSEVTRLLGVVDDMRAQRTKLIDQLRQDLLQDDITQLLIAGSGTAAASGIERSESEQAALYAQQLKKHDRVVAFLRQNMSAQENVAKKLEEEYVRFAPVKKKLEETERERTAQIGELCYTYEAYTSALEKAEEGVNFYERTSTSLTRVSARLERILNARRQMREQFEAKMAPKPQAPPPQPSMPPQAPAAVGEGGGSAGADQPPPSYVLAAVAAAVDYESGGGGRSPLPKTEPPSDGVPRLKDFLPHMKPKTFGRDAKHPPPASPQPSAGPTDPCTPTGHNFTVPHQGVYPTNYIQGLPAYSHASTAPIFKPTASPSVSNAGAAATTPVSSANAPIPATTTGPGATSDQDTRLYLPWFEGQQRAWALYNMPAEARVHYSVANRPTAPVPIDAPMSASTLHMQTVMSHRTNAAPIPASSASGESIATMPSSMSHIYGHQPPLSTSTTHHVTVESMPLTPQTQPLTTAAAASSSPSHQPRPSSPLQQFYSPQALFPTSVPHYSQPQQLPAYTGQQPQPHPYHAGFGYYPTSNHPTATRKQQHVRPQYSPYPTASATPPQTQAKPSQESPQGYPQPFPMSTAAQMQSQVMPQQPPFQQQQSQQVPQPYQQLPPNLQNQQLPQQQVPQPYQQLPPNLQNQQLPHGAYQQPQPQRSATQPQHPQAPTTLSHQQPMQPALQPQLSAAQAQLATSHHQQPMGHPSQPASLPQQPPHLHQHTQMPAAHQQQLPMAYPPQPTSSIQQQPPHSQQHPQIPASHQQQQPMAYPPQPSSSIQQHPQMPAALSQQQQPHPPVPQSQPTTHPQQPPQHQHSLYHSMPAYPYQPSYTQAGFGGFSQGRPGQSTTPMTAPYTVASAASYSLPQQPQQPSQTSESSGASSFNANNAMQLELQYNSLSSQKDLLSSSPLAPEPMEMPSPDPAAVLTPKVLTRQELEEQQAEETRLKKLAAVREAARKDPLDDNLNLNTFIAEVERFNRRLSELERYDSGELYNAWKALSDGSKNFPKKSMAIGRMYPMKNRFPEQVPYDENRVILKDAKDDYINAAHVDISGIDGLGESACCPKFIVAQAPLPTTLSDFWAMILEQGCEVVAMLACPAVSDVPANVRLPPHWPENKGEVRRFGQLEVLVQAQKEKEWWTERVLTVRRGMGLQTRTVVHLQFNHLLGAGGAKGGNPASAEGFASLANEVRALYKQQRSPIKPIAVLCGSGAGVSGTLVALYAAMLHIETSGRLPALAGIVLHLWEQRQGLVEDQEQLLLLHRAVTHFANDLLAKRNIVVSHGRKARPATSSQSSELSIPPSIPPSVPSSIPQAAEVPVDTSTSSLSKEELPNESSLTDLASNFPDLELNPSAAHRKFTRRDFMESRGASAGLLSGNAAAKDPSDPFANIDPLWSMKK